MSADTVDDLHAAEDFAGSAVAALEALLEDYQHPDAISRADSLIEAWRSYCRPTCGAEGDPTSNECGDHTCACPCGHNDADPRGRQTDAAGMMGP